MPDYYKKSFPKITLKAVRVNANMRQKEAAKALKISQATLQNYENGKTVPNALMVSAIEKVYHFPADFIIFGKHYALSEKQHTHTG